MQIVALAGDCARRISKVFGSVLSLGLILAPPANMCTLCSGGPVYSVQEFMSNGEVRVGDGGDEVILFLCLSNARRGVIQRR